jgi:hypothetical protein
MRFPDKIVLISVKEYEEYLLEKQDLAEDEDLLFFARVGNWGLEFETIVPVFEYDDKTQKPTGRHCGGILRERYRFEGEIVGYGVQLMGLKKGRGYV